jgi:hypothetical protein
MNKLTAEQVISWCNEFLVSLRICDVKDDKEVFALSYIDKDGNHHVITGNGLHECAEKAFNLSV